MANGMLRRRRQQERHLYLLKPLRQHSWILNFSPTGRKPRMLDCCKVHIITWTIPSLSAIPPTFFATILSNYPGDLPPVVDYEQARTDNNTNAARAYLREFLEILRARGHKPIIYTSSGFWSIYGDKNSYWTGFPLWLAQYTTASKPSVPLPWTRWTFWQYSSKGTGATYGTESFNVDMNRFDGTVDDLDALAGIRRPTMVELEQSNYHPGTTRYDARAKNHFD